MEFDCFIRNKCAHIEYNLLNTFFIITSSCMVEYIATITCGRHKPSHVMAHPSVATANVKLPWITWSKFQSSTMTWHCRANIMFIMIRHLIHENFSGCFRWNTNEHSPPWEVRRGSVCFNSAPGWLTPWFLLRTSLIDTVSLSYKAEILNKVGCCSFI